MKKNVVLSLLFAVVLTLQLFSQSATVSQMAYDMVGVPYRSGAFVSPWGKNEGLLHGMPTGWDQFDGAMPGFWMNGTGYTAVTTWAEVFEDRNESPETNVRVHVRNLKSYAYNGSAWVLIEQAEPTNYEGSWVNEVDYSGATAPTGANERFETGGGWSFNKIDNGLFRHWWVKNWPHASRPANAQAFFATCEMRLIPDTDPNVNLANAKYLACVGMDCVQSPTFAGAAPSMGIPRHKYLTANWQTFTIYVGGSIPTNETQYFSDIHSRPLPPGISADAPISVTGVSVTPTTASIGAGGTQQLTYNISPANASNLNVSWSSSNPSIATVNTSGVVSALAVGNANITITTVDGNKTSTCAVTVTAPILVTGVSLNLTSASIYAGGVEQLTATVSPSNATNKSVTWSSSNNAIATVNSNGLVTGIGVGNATITVTTQDGNKTSTCAFTIATAPAGPSGYSYNCDESDPVRVTGTMNIAFGANGSFYYKLNQTAGCGCDYTQFGGDPAFGFVKHCFVQAVGSVSVTGISVSPTTATVASGATTNLTATITPSNASNTNVSWTSSNTSIATVDASGVVTGARVGSATITVATQDGNKIATSTVTVTASHVGPAGYTYSCDESATVVVSGTMDIAFGANGSFNYLYNQTTNCGCNTGVFGDPISGVFKSCYTKASIVAGSLTGTFTQSTSSVNLTSVGTNDWKHFRNNDHKSSGSMINSIGNYTVIGGTSTYYANDLRKMSWSGGTPTASSSNNVNASYISGLAKGFSFTAVAGNGVNTLKVYVGGYNSGGKLTAHLSNNSAPDYIHTTSNISGQWDATYTITYNAAAPGATIIITWVENSDAGGGNVTIQAAALVGLNKSATIEVSKDQTDSNAELKIYPNPASSENVFIQKDGIQSPSTLIIYDLSGRELFILKNGIEANFDFNTNKLEGAGLYFVKLISGNNMYSGKFMVR